MSIASNDYLIFIVPQSFIDRPIEHPAYSTCKDSCMVEFELLQKMRMKVQEGSMDRLENIDCINAYARTFQSKRRNLVLVARDDQFPPAGWHTNLNGSSLIWLKVNNTNGVSTHPFKWMCSGLRPSQTPCAQAIEQVRTASDDWPIDIYSGDGWIGDTNLNPRIGYCLSEKADSSCKLYWNILIAAVVTVVNLLEAILMFYLAFAIGEEPLMTMGDAVASFLDEQDSTTSKQCFLSINELRHPERKLQVGPEQWASLKFRWKDVVSRDRHIFILAMLAIFIAVTSSFLHAEISSLGKDEYPSLASLATLGFGAADPRTTILYGVRSTLGNVMVANLPQVLVSIIYFMFNGFLSSMLLAREWASYAHHRKGLRVSRKPAGAQRSTYFLSLPYRFALPLMVLSGLLHWLVSQSIFLVAVDLYPEYSSEAPYDILRSFGYSPIALVFTILVSSFLFIASISLGNISLKPCINLAGSSSAAMSAACHLSLLCREDGRILSEEKLKWGVTSIPIGLDGIGHCSFSCGPVGFPIEGVYYQ